MVIPESTEKEYQMPHSFTEDIAPEVRKRKFTCDEVAWLGDALDRYRDAIRLAHQVPGVSRAAQVARTAAVLEIMEIFGLEFESRHAAGNALSNLPEFYMVGCPDPGQAISVADVRNVTE
jgi:hypothetical protein